jgi:hypothetical protein
MAIATDGTSIYVGGTFTTYRGGAANRVAKLSIAGLRDTVFSPNAGANGANNAVNSLSWNGTALFIGGTFTTYRGAVANRLAKVSDTGVLDATFSPATGGNGANNIVYVVNWIDGALFVGGTFTTYRGAPANRIVKVDASGVIDNLFSPATGANGANGAIRAISRFQNGNLALAGDFTTYRGGPAKRIAKVSAAGVLDLVFSPATGANGFSSGSVTAVTVDELDTVYAGGSFVSYRGQEARGIAGISMAGVLTYQAVTSAQANVILVDGEELICAGAFSFGRPDWAAQNIALVDSAGVPDSAFLSAGAANGFNNTVSALAADGSSLYVGGTFTTYRGAPANRIAKLNFSGVLDTVFSPATGGNGFNNTVSSLALDGTSIFAGGAFTQYRATAANRVTKINATTGVKDLVFSPNTGANGAGGTVSAVHVSGANLYIGGAFTAYRGAVANRFAKVSFAGALDTVVSPATGANGANNTVTAITSDGIAVYIGGSFTTYRGGVANRIAKVDSLGVMDLTFSPATGGNGANNAVLSIEYFSGALYAGGSFTQYRATAANRIVKIDAASGVKDLVFSPNSGANGAGGNVNSLKWNANVSRLAIGGDLTTYRGVRLFYFGKLQPTGIAD